MLHLLLILSDLITLIILREEYGLEIMKVFVKYSSINQEFVHVSVDCDHKRGFYKVNEGR
jgi:septum formation topological specificity factor MinE